MNVMKLRFQPMFSMSPAVPYGTQRSRNYFPHLPSYYFVQLSGYSSAFPSPSDLRITKRRCEHYPMSRRLLSTMASTAKRFAPLRTSLKPSASEHPTLRGVVFDMDGTLCEPQTYMFTDMRTALSIPKTTDILHHIESLPADSQPSALQAIRDIESKAMESQTPQPGLTELMTYLDAHSVRKAICTRNFDVPVQHLLSTFLSDGKEFHPIVTRDFKPPKPDPAGILHIAEAWGLVDGQGKGKGEGLIMVGDSIDDMTAGRMAGAATVLLVNDVNRHLAEHEHTDLVVSSLDELVGILEEGFKGREIVVE